MYQNTFQLELRVPWEHLAEATVLQILNFHHWQSFDFVSRVAGDTECEWTVFCTSIAPRDDLGCIIGEVFCPLIKPRSIDENSAVFTLVVEHQLTTSSLCS